MSAYEGIVAALEAKDCWPGEPGRGKARCPAHEDGTASLSVSAGDGCALIHDFGGCDTRDVMAALDLPMAALFDSWWAPQSAHRCSGWATWT